MGQDDEPVEDEKLYRTVAGKSMYLVHKLMIEGINTVQELTKHFAGPGHEHWAAVEYFAGFLKKERGLIKLILC